jgi:hypothetical protein
MTTARCCFLAEPPAQPIGKSRIQLTIGKDEEDDVNENIMCV